MQNLTPQKEKKPKKKLYIFLILAIACVLISALIFIGQLNCSSDWCFMSGLILIPIVILGIIFCLIHLFIFSK